MKVCLFNSFPFHYEMFGYFIDYFKDKCVVDIYTGTDMNMGWIKFYLEKFPGTIKLFPIKKFSLETRMEYDYVVVPTEEDPAFLDEWIDNRTVSVVHKHTNTQRTSIKHRVGLRYNEFLSDLSYALPIFPISSMEKSLRRDFVVCIGNNAFDITDKERFSKQFPEGFRTIFIDRRINTLQFSAYTCYGELSTEYIMTILENALYVFVSPRSECMMSASIPLALSHKCTLILPQNMSNYELSSAVYYDDPYKIGPLLYDENAVEHDVEVWMNRRNSVFDSIFKRC